MAAQHAIEARTRVDDRVDLLGRERAQAVEEVEEERAEAAVDVEDLAGVVVGGRVVSGV